ncbi:hypothetical protein EG328_007593 [Venturia inaequalis]|uniref:Pali-domain-containing protein n=1 Tax=Venturia inaequalis TaxID=5025 RepID=A0A8H3VAY5_VENIN|nr:hypothetical protein EG328_007593 [Venturia inaequalis]
MFRWLHTIGVVFMLAASILLLVTTISAPVINDIGILKVSLRNSSTVNFGTFGYCILDASSSNGNANSDYCTKKVIGYKPVDLMESIDGTDFNTVGRKTANGLTGSFILHPIASGLTFIAALVAVGGFFGSIVGLILAVLAWVLTVVVMAIDFAIFGGIRNHINKDGSGSSAKYSVGMWTTLAAMIILLLGIIIVFFTCCTDRRKKSREQVAVRSEKATTTSRRRWGRKSNY